MLVQKEGSRNNVNGSIADSVVTQGWQNPYIFSNKTAPVQFTTAHGHYVPEGASSVGFGFDGDGKWTFEGQNKFVACQTKDMVKQGPESGYQI